MKDSVRKNIIFLDFDGVINNMGFFVTRSEESLKKNMFLRDIDPANMRILNYILENTPGVEVIVSSFWGVYYNLEEIKEGLSKAGLKNEFKDRFIGITPRKLSSHRCHEVLWAIRDLEEEGYKVEKWITLDDHSIFPDHGPFAEYREREITTNSLHGLTVVDAWKIIKYFKPDFKEPKVLL